MGVLIAPMALAHPLYPIKSRSRNKHWNLWVGLCVSFRWPWFWPVYSIYYIRTIHYSCNLSNKNKTTSKRHTYKKAVWPCWCIGWFDTVIVSCLVSSVHFSCIVQYSLYHDMEIGIMWHYTLVSSTPSQSIGLIFGCALIWCWASLGASVTWSLI